MYLWKGVGQPPLHLAHHGATLKQLVGNIYLSIPLEELTSEQVALVNVLRRSFIARGELGRAIQW